MTTRPAGWTEYPDVQYREARSKDYDVIACRTVFDGKAYAITVPVGTMTTEKAKKIARMELEKRLKVFQERR